MNMKTIEIAGNTIDIQELLRLASDNNLILRTEDGKEFLLAEVDDFEQEVALVRQQPELMAFLEERSKPDTTYTLDQVKEMLGLD
jgi:hypothetical protein